jgi:hypothetical protein
VSIGMHQVAPAGLGHRLGRAPHGMIRGEQQSSMMAAITPAAKGSEASLLRWPTSFSEILSKSNA